MAELDTCTITNPSDQDFSVRFNGELYSLRAGETKAYPRHLSFHMAKHLSNRWLQENEGKQTIDKHKDDNAFVPQYGMLMNHDNPTRRKYLYQILRSKSEVELCVVQNNLKSFIGEMSEYDKYVAELEASTESEPEDTIPPEDVAKAKVPKAKKGE